MRWVHKRQQREKDKEQAGLIAEGHVELLGSLSQRQWEVRTAVCVDVQTHQDAHIKYVQFSYFNILCLPQ